jgi:hypothetical protein
LRRRRLWKRRRKKEEGIRKKEEGRRKKEEGRRKKEVCTFVRRRRKRCAPPHKSVQLLLINLAL